MRNLSILCCYLLTTFLSFSIANVIVLDKVWLDGHAYPSLLIISVIGTILSYFISNQNLVNATSQIPQLVLKSIEYIIVLSLLVLAYWFIVRSENYNKEHISIFLLINFLSIIFFNFIYVRYLRFHKIGIPIVNALVVGKNNFSHQFVKSLRTNDWMGFRLQQQISPKKLSNINFKEYLLTHKIDRVFICWDEFHLDKETEIILRNLTEEDGIKFYAISEFFGSRLLSQSYNLVGTFPYLQLFSFPLDKPLNAGLKRLFDILFSVFFFLLIGSWLFPLIIVILVISQGFPIFFSQKRHGIDNREFNCYKFRTMVQNKGSNHKITVKNDPRVTRMGRVLRKTSIDELPQFWNVLKGDMSIVGPRPHMLNQNDYYNQVISKYNFRHYVKPGITGLAQVNGFRGEIKKKKDMQDRVQADLYYIRNWSFRLDISIIYRTIANMIRGDENAI